MKEFLLLLLLWSVAVVEMAESLYLTTAILPFPTRLDASFVERTLEEAYWVPNDEAFAVVVVVQ